ncbi:hypothetical protein [Roseicella sp. DB1501]|uniref:hypothetical protein n=1 Tax=Roseicella sp. DB1501 TaxID=2730925 RepID=UPI001491B653|nr:hypothetical protein [Roseicella sp. DB1501]NOG70183.1 hypothetical protein [Roseicella sp. DB1501]
MMPRVHPRRPNRQGQARMARRRAPVVLPRPPEARPEARAGRWAQLARRCGRWMLRHWQRLRAQIRAVPFGEPW